jgi:peptidoglycan/LPS O-acetylase OafA/YrhL
MNYRHEIDGLRVLAVVPVILFHTGFEKFSGGFVGDKTLYRNGNHLSRAGADLVVDEIARKLDR